MTSEESRVEFSRMVPVNSLGKEGEPRRIEATAAECEALARRFGLVSLEGLRAEMTVRLSGKRGRVRLSGVFEADVVQDCVISQDPVATHVKESFNWLFEPQREETSEDSGEDLALSYDAGEAEPLEGEELDIGECVAQYLSLALDPYPQSPGARVPPELTGELTGNAGMDADADSDADSGRGEAKTPDNPFSVLRALKSHN